MYVPSQLEKIEDARNAETENQEQENGQRDSDGGGETSERYNPDKQKHRDEERRQ